MTTPLDIQPGTAPAPSRDGGTPATPAHTGSRRSRVLGIVLVPALALWAFLGLVGTPPDLVQGESQRLFYVHVPVVTTAYLACLLAGVSSALYLWKRTQFWDLLASSAVEVAVPFTLATLVSGSIWGGASWGDYWVWDARITSTALLFLVQLGYLAVRRVPSDRTARARRSAILGLLLVPNMIIINQSVNWWNSVHQPATMLAPSVKQDSIGGLMYFAATYSVVVNALVFAWLVLHRFRVAYLEDQVEDLGLEQALTERRQEAGR